MTPDEIKELVARPNPAFDAWRDSLPATSWSGYDLSAVKLGYEAGSERRSVTTQASEGAVGYLFEMQYPSGNWSGRMFSETAPKHIPHRNLVPLYAAPNQSKRVERLETALRPFAFDGMNFPHGEFLRVSVKLSDIEAVRQALGDRSAATTPSTHDWIEDAGPVEKNGGRS